MIVKANTKKMSRDCYVSEGVDVNSQDKNGRTALHEAMEFKNSGADAGQTGDQTGYY